MEQKTTVPGGRRQHEGLLHYFARNMFTVIGLVLIWRGIWYVLDGVDLAFAEGSHWWTALIGIAVGLAMLYLPDKNLKELEKL